MSKMEFLDFHSKSEIVVIDGDEYDLINQIFLLENASYADGIINRFNFDKVITLYYESPFIRDINIEIDDVLEVEFDSVDILVGHGFGGNTYCYSFYLSGTQVLTLFDNILKLNKIDVINDIINKENKNIIRYEAKITNSKDIINRLTNE